MKTGLPLILLLALGASEANAETSLVRSGEHDTFTRLTMRLPQNVDWTIDQADRSATLAVDAKNLSFDTRQVFRRIPRTRLADIAQGGPGEPLILSLACDCTVEHFVQSGSLLVIDITESSAEPEVMLSPLLPFSGTTYRFNQGIAAGPKPANWATPSSVEVPRDNSLPALPDDPTTPSVSALNQIEVGLNVSERRLLAQIGRAASQGLLTPASELPAEKDRRQDEAAQEVERTLPISVSAATAVDRDMASIVQALPNANTAQVCLPDEVLALRDPTESESLPDQVSQLRSELHGEFDSLDENAALALVRTYVNYGFGAEALSILDLGLPESVQTASLRRMAEILDDLPSTIPDPFRDQQHCTGDAALWSLLSQDVLTRDANKDAIQQSFTGLPRHLREHLGPRLSEKIAKSGHLDLAAAILRAIDRSDNQKSAGHEFVDGVISKADGQHDDALASLESVLAEDNQYSPRALIELIDTHWDERKSVTPDLTVLAGAYATELSDADLGPDLRRTHAVALGLSSDFSGSFLILSEISETDSKSDRILATNQVFQILTENAGDVAFLRFVLGLQGQLVSDAETALIDLIALRLLELGFPAEALDILSESETGSANSERRLMKARAALSLEKPHRALVELLGVSGTEADRLRAEAMWQNGDAQAAGELQAEVEENEDTSRYFWHGNAWERISPETDLQYARVAEASRELSRDLVRTGDMPPLSGARALLADSEKTRADIREMMTSLEGLDVVE